MTRKMAPRAPHLILCGPTPPPISGQSLAFQALVDKVRRLGLSHDLVDIAPRKGRPAKGEFALSRMLELVAPIGKFAWACLLRRGTVYHQIGQSFPAFLRDVAFIGIGRLTGHRVVVHLHGGNYAGFYRSQGPLRQRMIRLVLRRVDRILILSERLRSDFDFEPALRDRLVIVPMGVLEEPDPVANATQAQPPPLRIVYVSGLTLSKGYRTVLEAARILSNDMGVDVRADFGGAFRPESLQGKTFEAATDDMRRDFEDFVRANKLENVVTLHGPVSDAQKRSMLSRGHVFPLPTRYANEGMPVAILEAMAYGNVVISTRYRAIPDMVEDGVTGYLVDVDDPTAIATICRELSKDPERLRRVGKNAQTLIASHYTLQHHLTSLLEALDVPEGTRAEGTS